MQFSRQAGTSQFTFGSKAETLKRLQDSLSLSYVPPFHYFTVCEWNTNQKDILRTTQLRFDRVKVIIRSSAFCEDGVGFSLAGACDSIPDVDAWDAEALRDSINRVISSYNKSTFRYEDKDQVLVQLMIEDVSMSGVLFTQDLNTGAPYYVINYDDESGRTDTITSGSCTSNRTLLVHRGATQDVHSKRFKALLGAVQEIERITKCSSLDIEFALARDNKVNVFQVRQITTAPNWNRGIALRIDDAIRRIKEFVSQRFKPTPGVRGSRSMFGQMPDWNPAEMIGTAPRPLALSLYRKLITDGAWREARRLMGYAEPRGAPLMVSLAGIPYIDVRLSFHSFLPSQLEDTICDKLVEAWLDRLSEHHELHDKIEFDVAVTALTFAFEKLFRQRLSDVLTSYEKGVFRRALHNLTNNLVCGKVASVSDMLDKIDFLERRRHTLLEGNDLPELITVNALLEDCVAFGTVPFSILARHAFISQAFLDSMVQREVIEPTDRLAFQRSIKTVAGDLVDDMDKHSIGKISSADFMARYGHLRPGTYDILSMRYDQREDLMQASSQSLMNLVGSQAFDFTSQQLQDIQKLMKETGFDVNVDHLVSYMKGAIKAREYAKFVFTRNVSDSLEIIALWGERVGLSREELSYLNINDILDSASVAEGRTLEQYLRDKSVQGGESHEITKALRLPHIIESVEDISVVPLLVSQPNFIGSKTVRGTYCFLDGRSEQPTNISGTIVLIENADPGFDWIFSRPLLGLVTKFGGANSHMAVRCAEFGLTAAIGCGEQIFDRIMSGRTLEINPSEERIVPIGG